MTAEKVRFRELGVFALAQGFVRLGHGILDHKGPTEEDRWTKRSRLDAFD